MRVAVWREFTLWGRDDMVVLIIDADPAQSTAPAVFLRDLGHTPVTADTLTGAVKILKRQSVGLVLLGIDGEPSRAVEFLEMVESLDDPPPVIVCMPKAKAEDAVRIMKRGAHDFWIKPVSFERLSKTLQWIEAKAAKAAPAPAVATASAGKAAPGAAAGDSPAPRIVLKNPAMLQVKAMAQRVAASSATVFIQGESGTGKEMFARFIHCNSNRRDKPFVAINCAALPETLIESELFGYEKGAFTGAVKAKEGKFELAHTGTIFLDEVTEIPIHLQAKLLRVLQESEVDRVGGKHPIRVDVRVIATTNLRIEEALQEGRFRKDLYYRLNVIPLKLPPLRERREDIALLCRFFIEKHNGIHGCSVKDVTQEALRMLQEYPWPGNVRELENVVQRGVLLSNDQLLTPECLIFDRETHAPAPEEPGNIDLMSISEMEKRLIYKALDTVSGNRTRAAEILGISVRTLRNKLNEYRGMTGI